MFDFSDVSCQNEQDTPESSCDFSFFFSLIKIFCPLFPLNDQIETEKNYFFSLLRSKKLELYRVKNVLDRLGCPRFWNSRVFPPMYFEREKRMYFKIL